MEAKYVVFTRYNKDFCTILPKHSQTCEVVRFFVKKQFADKFPKKEEISWEAIALADLVFADGKLIKNVYGTL